MKVAPGTTSSELSRNNIRRLFWIAGATCFLGLFLLVTAELNEQGGLDRIDRTLLVAIGDLRFGRLNGIAVDLTALGSVTVLTAVTLIALLFLHFLYARF